jgi:hypothetical protein
MRNSTPEYVSTTSILKPFKKKFLKKWFSPQISSKHPVTPWFLQGNKIVRNYLYKQMIMVVAFHAGAYFYLGGGVLLYFIVWVEVIKIQIWFEIKLIWNL